MHEKSTLTLKKISKSFVQGPAELTIFSQVSMTFDSEKSYALSGISGSGKSTLLNILAGIEKPTSGQVLLNDRPIEQLTNQEKRAHLLDDIGLIFQTPYLLHELTVLENVIIKGIFKEGLGLEHHERARELLAKVGLESKINAMPSELSGGEQQRVAIARALFKNPKFLLADEPTAHLDEKNRDAIVSLLEYFKQEEQVGLIIASHDPLVTQKMDVVVTLHENSLVL